MVRKDAKVKMLATVPLFSACSRKELEKIEKIADELDLPEGKVLCKEGESGREFFVLLGGEAIVRRRGRKVNTLGEGDFFGEIALISKLPRTATVTAATPLRALVVTGRDFVNLLERQPAIQLKVLRALADRLARDAV